MKKTSIFVPLMVAALAGCAEKADQPSPPVAPVTSAQLVGPSSLFGTYETVEVVDRQVNGTIATLSGEVLACNSTTIGEPDLSLGVRKYLDDQREKEIPSVQVSIDFGFSKGVCYKDGLVLFRDRGNWTEDDGSLTYKFAGSVKKSDSVSGPLRSVILEIETTFTPVAHDLVRVISHENEEGRSRTVSYLLRRK